ncbi:CAP domain-containing protein [Cellulomonas sp. CW35]|uniref:CAP domain-containing protein n=1 Tax=Cellulomonas sp. CW35 TaxID=3458249 RepID=UPI0040342991
MRRRTARRRARRQRRRRLTHAALTLVVLGALALVVPAVLAPGAREAAGPVVEVPAGPTTPPADPRDGVREPASRSAQRSASAAPTTTPPPTTPTTTRAGQDERTAPSPSGRPSSPRATSAPSSAAPSSAPPDVAPTPADEIVALTNEARRDAGLDPLEVSTCATDQAADRAAVLAAEDRFEHDPLEPVLQACDARSVGENLALGYPTARATVDGWLDSPGHRANLLGDFTSIGVGCADTDRGPLCAQVFLA